MAFFDKKQKKDEAIGGETGATFDKPISMDYSAPPPPPDVDTVPVGDGPVKKEKKEGGALIETFPVDETLKEPIAETSKEPVEEEIGLPQAQLVEDQIRKSSTPDASDTLIEEDAGPTPFQPTQKVEEFPVGEKPQPQPEVEMQPEETKEEDVVDFPPSPKRKIPKMLPIIGGIVILLIIVIFVVRLVLPGSKEPSSTTITWWGLWEDEATVANLIDDYQRKNPTVTIDYVRNSPQDYRERLTNAFAKGEGPDVFRFHNSWVPMFTKDLDNVPSSVMSAAEYAETYYPVIASDMTQGTGLVGIPLGYDSLTLFINIDIFEEAGIDPPETWVELREAAKNNKLTVVENGVIKQAGVALGLTQNVDHWPEIIALMMLQNGVDLSSPGGKLAEDAIVFYTLFTKKDKVWDISQPPSTIAFASGRLAMYFGPTWRAFEFIRESPELRFRTVPLPQLPKDRPNDPNVAYANYWVEGVWSKSKNKEVAWDFVKHLSSRESLVGFFESASRVRSFGEPYPRVDMAGLLIDHPIIGSVIQLAPEAKSWYLVSRTFDGETGINSQINKYFEDAINAVGGTSNPKNEVETLVAGVQQILAQYGLR